MTTEILKTITESLGGSQFRFAFACMEVAEEEIQRARLTKAQGSQAFKALLPTGPLRGKTLELYRAHAHEICNRIKRGAKLEPATDAELLAVFSDTSLVAPFHNNAAAAMEILFQNCFPREELEGVPAGRERWTGAAREEIEQARRKFQVEDRK